MVTLYKIKVYRTGEEFIGTMSEVMDKFNLSYSTFSHKKLKEGEGRAIGHDYFLSKCSPEDMVVKDETSAKYISNNSEIDVINAKARAEGLSYGQYVAKYKLYTEHRFRRTAAQIEREENDNAKLKKMFMNKYGQGWKNR